MRCNSGLYKTANQLGTINFEELKSERELTLSISMFFENENSEIEGQLLDGLKKNEKNFNLI